MSNETKSENLQQEGNSKWILVMIVLVIGAFMSILDSSIVNVALDAMMSAFQTTLSHIQWVVTIYMLVLGVVVPTSGWLGEYLGFKRLYIYSLIVFTVGSALCTLAWSENILIAARVVQAIGGGMIMPTTMAMIYSLVPRHRIGSAMGIFGLTILFAPALGPTIGGYLVEYVNWRWIFTINLPVGIAGVLLAIAFLPELGQKKAGKFDIWGFLTSAISLFCLLFALSEGQDWGWTSLSILLLFYTSFVTAILFVYHEMTTPEPLLDLRVFKYPSFLIGNTLLMVLTVCLFARLFFIPFFLENVRGLGAFSTGLILMPSALEGAILMPISGRLYDKIGPKIPVTLGIFFLFCGTYLFTKIDTSTSMLTIIKYNMVFSLGMGFAMMPLQTAVMVDLSQAEIGRGSAITNIVSRVSSAMGTAVLTVILVKKEAFHSAFLTWHVSGQNLHKILSSTSVGSNTVLMLLETRLIKVSFVQSLRDMFYITVVISFLAFCLSFLLPNKRSQHKGSISAE